VVGHQEFCPDLDFGLARLLGEQVSINLVVAVLKDDGLAAISSAPRLL
jgi:hypothetical protein